MANLADPRCHFRLGVEVENAQENLFVRIDDLLHAPLDNFRKARRELGREPTILECLEHWGDAFGTHRSDNATDLGTVVRGSKRRRAVQTERQHAVGIAPSVRGADHPAERVTCEMRFLDVQFPPQCLHILDEIIKRIRRLW